MYGSTTPYRSKLFEIYLGLLSALVIDPPLHPENAFSNLFIFDMELPAYAP